MAQTNCQLVILVEPKDNFRFRTINDVNHGSLPGIDDNVITVKLEGFTGRQSDVIVLCSIYQSDGEYQMIPHPNLLIKSEGIIWKWNRNFVLDPIESGLNDDGTARFPGLEIVRTKNRDILETLNEKLRRIRVYKPTYMNNVQMANIDPDIFNMNNIRLCFEAFERNGESFSPICNPIFSRNIAHIIREPKDFVWYCAKCTGKATGNKNLIIVCDYPENINKDDIKVRFFQYKNNNSVWEKHAINNFFPFCSHGLIITIPPYENVDIVEEERVFFEMYADTNNGRIISDIKSFIYEPQ